MTEIGGGGSPSSGMLWPATENSTPEVAHPTNSHDCPDAATWQQSRPDRTRDESRQFARNAGGNRDFHCHRALGGKSREDHGMLAETEFSSIWECRGRRDFTTPGDAGSAASGHRSRAGNRDCLAATLSGNCARVPLTIRTLTQYDAFSLLWQRLPARIRAMARGNVLHPRRGVADILNVMRLASELTSRSAPGRAVSARRLRRDGAALPIPCVVRAQAATA